VGVMPLAAAAYHGPPALTVDRAFTGWVLDPWSLAVILLLALAYLTGVRRVRRAGQEWPAGRVISFCGLGLGFAVIATMSFLGVYQNTLFYARAAQTTVLLLLVPLFLALGRPLTLAIAAAPKTGARIETAVHSRVAKIATFPAITTMVLVVMPFLVYFSGWYVASMQSTTVRELTHVAFILPGLVFFWTLLRVDPVPKSYPYVVALWITGAEVIGDAVLGLAIIADPHLIASTYYHLLARPWGPSLGTDQVLGGGTLWVFGDIVGLPFLAAQLIQMIREDEHDAKIIDAELDAAEAAEAAEAAAAAAAVESTGAADAAGALQTPQTQQSQPPQGSAAPTGTAGAASDAPSGQAALAAASAATGEPTPAGDHAGGRAPSPARRRTPATQRPWWESDPRFAERFQPGADPAESPPARPAPADPKP
jgi:cytochrome c oxidase assembly factor CtaG